MKKKFFTLTLAIVCIIALSAAFTACDNGSKSTTEPETETPKPETVTVAQDVTATFPAFSAGTSIDFTPAYTPDGAWKTNLSASDITYTVTVTGTGVNKTYSGTGLTANLTEGYTEGNTYNFTQTFKNSKGEVIGSQVIKAPVLFSSFASLKDANDVTLSPQAIPSVTFTLSKEVPK
jgi:hypothetical protein